ncbi:MAG: hypothetical protein EOO73_35520 [Myxococcales bacterium]|nr:MAG: hypothetical protein EOO73_35520 [Myxococcales bacterium]
MQGHTEGRLVSLDVSFGAAPPQALVTPLCQSLLEMCRPTLDEDAASRLRLTAHELLENIAKYSAEDGCELRFTLRRAGAALFATVETRNVPRGEHRHDVDERLAALCAARDPHEHYDAVIASSARQPAGSGLGLARIHAETEYRISHHFEGEALVIVASGEIWSKSGEQS